jgi:hypothetical protein
MQIIKVQFLKGEVPSGRAYTYFSDVVVSVDDLVQINSAAKGIVTEVDVPESEIEAFRDKVKSIVGKVVAESKEEPSEHFNVLYSMVAQERYCKEKEYPNFVPNNGICWKCNQQIYAEGKNRMGNLSKGISVEKAGSELITGCPHCNWSYCD